MGKTKIIAGILLVFLSGLAIGAVGGQLYARYKIERLVKGGPPPEMMPRLMRRFARELDLTFEERRALEPITRDMMTALSELRKEYHPRLEEIIETHFARIREILPEEKQERLTEVRERLRRWRDRPRHRRGGPPGRLIGFLQRELDLTPDQVDRIRALARDRFRDRHRRGDGPPPHGPGPGRPPLWRELDGPLREILTPVQNETLDRLEAEGRMRPPRGVPGPP